MSHLSHSLSTLCIEGTFSPIFAGKGVVGCGPKSYDSEKACYSSFQLFHVFKSSRSLPALFFFSFHVASVAHIYMCKLYGSMNLNCPVYSVKLWCKLYPMTVEFYKKQSIVFLGRNAMKGAFAPDKKWTGVLHTGYLLTFNVRPNPTSNLIIKRETFL